MVIIFSHSFDKTTCEVIAWLHSRGIDVKRINEFSFNSLSLSMGLEGNISYGTFFIRDQAISLNAVKTVWCRRMSLSFSSNRKENLRIQKITESEILATKDSFYASFRNAVLIGDPAKSSINKYNTLLEAQAVGLNVPPTCIANTRSCIQDFYNHYKPVIIKPIYETYSINNMRLYTNILEQSIINGLNEICFPCMIQKQVQKFVELRIFYLIEQFYSMAIFSQEDENTKVDFRRYNYSKPNRKVPFNLPQKIKDQINKLMTNLSLNIGVIDMILTPTGDYVFLEVNPCGQFDDISKFCNYYLEQILSEKLE